MFLEKLLHEDFRITNTRFMGNPAVTVIDKKEYLNEIRSGELGRLPRQMNILNIEQQGSIASVTPSIEIAENPFISFNSMVLDTDKQWKIINSLAVVKNKK